MSRPPPRRKKRPKVKPAVSIGTPKEEEVDVVEGNRKTKNVERRILSK